MKRQNPQKYRVLVWDHEEQDFVNFYRFRVGPFKLMKIREILRELASYGYETGRDSPSVLVERV